MSTKTEKVYPFYCGSQIADWKSRNCERCAKGYDSKAEKWRCDLEKGMDEAYMNDGSYTSELAKAIGTPDDCTAHSWQCPVFEEAKP